MQGFSKLKGKYLYREPHYAMDIENLRYTRYLLVEVSACQHASRRYTCLVYWDTSRRLGAATRRVRRPGSKFETDLR